MSWSLATGAPAGSRIRVVSRALNGRGARLYARVGSKGIIAPQLLALTSFELVRALLSTRLEEPLRAVPVHGASAQ